MAVTPTSFREAFPAFASETVYTEAAITFWLSVAAQFVNQSRWQEAYDLGLQLFAAHNLVLEQQAEESAAKGAPPGTSVGGVVSGKSVDKVSINYDTGAAAELDAGHWNMSTYGKRYIRFARMIGAGPIQIGAKLAGIDPLSSANAWPGPDTAPGWFSS